MGINGKTIGMFGFTAAALLLLSGLWCIYLSPISIYGPDVPNTAWRRIFYEPDFQPNSTLSYNFTVQENQYVRIQIENIEGAVLQRFYNAFIYDQEGNLVFQKQSDSRLPFDYIPEKTGQYVLSIRNQPYVNTSIKVEMIGYYAIFRPLISTGQLLILMSIPLCGFALLIIKTERIVEAVVLAGATALLLCGLWCIYLSPIEHFPPSSLSDINISWTKTFPTIEFKPNSVANYTFTAGEGEYVQVQIYNLWFTEYKRVSYTVFNFKNAIVLENHYESSGNVNFGFLSKSSEQYTLCIYNQPDVTTQLTVEITGYYATSRPTVSAGVFLTLISLPLYGFGVWLIKRKSKHKP